MGVRAATATGLGLAGAVVTATGSWVPSFWGDEAASILSAERTLPSLFAVLGHVDAVHGTYYLFLHFWIELFGSSPFATRLPSALAMGVAVAGTFLIGDALVSRATGVIAAIVLAVLPSVSFFGGEARSYAFATAIAVWLTLAFLSAVRRPRPAWLPWVAYAVLLGFGVWVFLYVVLLVPAHGIYLLSSRATRRRLGRWVLAVLVGLALAAPILAIGYQQRAQISFLGSRRHLSYRSVLVYQWLGNGYLATLAWALVLVAVVAAVIVWRRRERSELTVLAAAIVVIPPLLLALISLVTPTYDIRYVSFAAPALALLVAIGITSLPRTWLRAVAVVAVVALAVPTDIGQREPEAYNPDADWARAASIIGSDAHPGDAVVFDATTRPSQRPRLALRLYPSDFVGLRDVELKQPFYERTTLWDSTLPVDQVAARLSGVRTVWLLQLTNTVDSDAGTSIFALRAQGYTQHLVATVNRMQIYRFTRGAESGAR